MQRVAVIGGGLMGAGIAHSFAVAGYDVTICEPDAQVAESLPGRIAETLRLVGAHASAIDRITVTASMAAALDGTDFVTEAAPERLELKRSIFLQIEALASSTAILASNTSVIPITQIAAPLERPQRVIGTHWWNPPYLVPLVEVIQAEHTSIATIDATMALLRDIGKQPAHVRKDMAGFVANRLQHALWREAIAMVADGICDAETLDACVKSSFGLRLAVLGPLENADLVGLDLTLDIHSTMMPELDRHDRPHPYLESRVAAGDLGFKTGRGFRDWTPEQIAGVRARLIDHLLRSTRAVP